MIYLPSSRRNLLIAVSILIIVLRWRSSSRAKYPVRLLQNFEASALRGRIRDSLIPFNLSGHKLAYGLESPFVPPLPQGNPQRNKTTTSSFAEPLFNPNLDALWRCSPQQEVVNPYTGHVRLPNIIQNISSKGPYIHQDKDTQMFWNPTVLALPYWADNQYLIVSRIVTDGNYQTNVVCEANFCSVDHHKATRTGERFCSEDDIQELGAAGGLRCATRPATLSVPPTPARFCDRKFASYVDIPGFHDPRIFYSSRGEPLMIVNTQSRYSCFGLWMIDLRSVYSPLKSILSSSPNRWSLGPLLSYGYLTELTRNPSLTRNAIEKNWFLFFPRTGSSYIHYDISAPQNPNRGRTFAKLLGGGLTTTNLTDPYEEPCIYDLGDEEPDPAKRGGKWHQATNALRLVLCNRWDPACDPEDSNTVFFAIFHRKHANYFKLPLRYERYFAVWSGVPPFSMLGMSKHPVLFKNETASGWPMWKNWEDDEENKMIVDRNRAMYGLNATDPFGGKEYWAYFTYSVSISWAWREKVEVDELSEGYLDDEVVVSVGIDDIGQGVARVKATDVIGCLRACPGRSAQVMYN